MPDKAEQLKAILKNVYGIETQEELECALANALKTLTFGIMTEHISAPANSA